MAFSLSTFSALNSSSTASTSTTTTPTLLPASVELSESQERRCHTLYMDALQVYSRGEYRASERLFGNIVDSLNSLSLRNELGNQLLFGAAKHRALSLLRQPRADDQRRLQLLLEAVDIDEKAACSSSLSSKLIDVNLYLHLATVALRLSRPHVARAALERVLKHSPSHIFALETMLKLCEKLGDRYSSLYYAQYICHHVDSGHSEALKILEGGLNSPFPKPYFIQVDLHKETLACLRFRNQELKDTETFIKALAKHARPAYASQCCRIRVVDDDYVDEESEQGDVEGDRNKSGSVEVSVQNAVHEMIDLVSTENGSSCTNGSSEESVLVVQSILHEMISATVLADHRRRVNVIAQDIINSVIESVVAPKSTSTRSVKASFFSEVPLDLIEKRRSSRVTQQVVSSMCEEQLISNASNTNSQKVPTEDVTVQTLLSGFIPSKLKNAKRITSDTSSIDSSMKKSAEKTRESERDVLPTSKDNGDEESDLRGLIDKLNNCALLNQLLITVLIWLVKRSSTDQKSWSVDLRGSFLELYVKWRESFVLPDEFEEHEVDDDFFDYIKVIMAANEIVVDGDGLVLGQEVVEEDLLHLNLFFHTRLDDVAKLRVLNIQFLRHLKADKVNEALALGKMMLDLFSSTKIHCAVRSPTLSQVLSKEGLQNQLRSLQYSKVMDKIHVYYDEGKYSEVIEVLNATLMANLPSDSTGFDEWCSQLYLMIEANWSLNQFDQVFRWSELALYKLVEMGLTEEKEINDVLTYLDSCLKTEITDVKDSNTIINVLSSDLKLRLCESLVQIFNWQIGKDLNVLKANITSWLLFYKVISTSVDKEKKAECVLPAKFLACAHDYIGQMSLCTQDNGLILLTLMDEIIQTLEMSIGDETIASLNRSMEQALYCLFAHPSKKNKAKHLEDHGVNQIVLKWSHCLKLYAFLRPQHLPEFDDFKATSISSDVEGLLRRIFGLVPDKYDLDGRKQSMMDRIGYMQSKGDKNEKSKANKEDKREKVDGEANFEPSPLETPTEHFDIPDLFYLLADYSFKSRTFSSAIDFYLLDLSFNSHRFDSWVALALSMANGVENRIIDNPDAKAKSSILSEARQVLFCLRRSFEIRPSNVTILIEGGAFAFSVASHCSHRIKSECNELSVEAMEELEAMKWECLKMAEQAYDRVLSSSSEEVNDNGNDERWLIYFMKGKIAEKFGLNIRTSIKFYLKGIEDLVSMKATIPKRINYNSPPHLALELLELVYRLHATILKRRCSSSRPQLTLEETQFCFDAIQQVRAKHIFNHVSNDMGDDKVLDVFEQAAPSSEEIHRRLWLELSRQCIRTIEQANGVFAQGYRCLTLLATYYLSCHDRLQRDANKARGYMMALFADKKSNNYFNGLWRHPMAEVDRPGNFARHISKSVSLLLDIAQSFNDSNTLLDLSVQLRKLPEGDRQYLLEKDRKRFAEEALNRLMTMLRNKFDLSCVQPWDIDGLIRVCLELSSAHMRLRRVGLKEEPLKLMLRDGVARIMQIQSPNDKASFSGMPSFDVAQTVCTKLQQFERAHSGKKLVFNAETLAEALKTTQDNKGRHGSNESTNNVLNCNSNNSSSNVVSNATSNLSTREVENTRDILRQLTQQEMQLATHIFQNQMSAFMQQHSSAVAMANAIDLSQSNSCKKQESATSKSLTNVNKSSNSTVESKSTQPLNLATKPASKVSKVGNTDIRPAQLINLSTKGGHKGGSSKSGNMDSRATKVIKIGNASGTHSTNIDTIPAKVISLGSKSINKSGHQNVNAEVGITTHAINESKKGNSVTIKPISTGISKEMSKSVASSSNKSGNGCYLLKRVTVDLGKSLLPLSLPTASSKTSSSKRVSVEDTRAHEVKKRKEEPEVIVLD